MWEDFSSRIGTQKDFMFQNSKDLNFVPESYKPEFVMWSRNNKDFSINYYGVKLLGVYVETNSTYYKIHQEGSISIQTLYRFPQIIELCLDKTFDEKIRNLQKTGITRKFLKLVNSMYVLTLYIFIHLNK